MPLFKRDAYRYSVLNTDRTRPHMISILDKYSSRRLLVTSLSVVLLLCASFIIGRYSVTDVSLMTIPLVTESKVFHYDRRFGSLPSNDSDTAWTEIFPDQGGFFKHPTLAPQRSAFSVFHQLHCLDGFRHGYATVYEAALEGRKMEEGDFPFMSSPAHIRHCIDLLRQSLMCQPDTTIEVKDEELGGVTGFGTMHKCRSWKQLMDWTSQWQWYEYEPKQGRVDSTHHHNHGPSHND